MKTKTYALALRIHHHFRLSCLLLLHSTCLSTDHGDETSTTKSGDVCDRCRLVSIVRGDHCARGQSGPGDHDRRDHGHVHDLGPGPCHYGLPGPCGRETLEANLLNDFVYFFLDLDCRGVHVGVVVVVE